MTRITTHAPAPTPPSPEQDPGIGTSTPGPPGAPPRADASTRRAIGPASRAGTPEARPHPPTPAHNRALGAHGEDLAADYLERLGYRVLARNWRTRTGELDLVARDGDTLVAVEVKTRSGSGYGSPLEAITTRKMARLRRLLLDWVRERGVRGARLRVDAVGITVRPGAAPRIDHLRGIS